MTTTTMTTNTAPLSQADARELTDQIAEGLADVHSLIVQAWDCLLYTSPSPRD